MRPQQGEERSSRACATIHDHTLGVIETIERDSLVVGEVIELLAYIVDDEGGFVGSAMALDLKAGRLLRASEARANSARAQPQAQPEPNEEEA